MIEGLKVERLDRVRSPEPQEVHHAAAVSADGRVVRHAFHHVGRHPAHAEVAMFVVILLGVAAAVDRIGYFRAADLPGIAKVQPLVGLLHLPAVADLLVEQPELVANTVADGGNLSGWPSNPCSMPPACPGRHCPVPAPALPLDVVQVETQLRKRRFGRFADAEIQKVVPKLRPDEKFRRKICRRS